MIQNPTQYRPPEFFAHASAIAFGGEITQVQLRDGGAHENVVPPMPIAGASCALAPGVYRAVNERVDAVTRYRGFEVVRAGSLYASAVVQISENSARTTLEAALGGLSIGFPKRRPLRVHMASTRMVTDWPKGPGPAQFRLAAPELELEGLRVNFLPADQLPPNYASSGALRTHSGAAVKRRTSPGSTLRNSRRPTRLGFSTLSSRSRSPMRRGSS